MFGILNKRMKEKTQETAAVVSVCVTNEININPHAQLGGALLVTLAMSAVWLVADLLNLPPTSPATQAQEKAVGQHHLKAGRMNSTQFHM